MVQINSVLFCSVLFCSVPQLNAQPLMRDFIGVNVALPHEKSTQIGHTRVFHLWDDDQGSPPPDNPTKACPFEPNTLVPPIRWNPSRNGVRFINYDNFYQSKGKKSVAVMHGCSPWMYGNSGELFAKPICQPTTALDQTTPDNWLPAAMRASLFAARYGKAPVGGFPTGFSNNIANFVTSPDNTSLGKGTVPFIEIFNEADAAWHGTDGVNTSVTKQTLETDPPGNGTKYYFRPNQYAAMLSAVYDGHKQDPAFKILNTNAFWGIKNLSSQTKIVLAGTADLRYDYLFQMKKHWDATRGVGDYPFDIVNYHFYSTSGTPAINSGTEWDKMYRGRSFFGTNNSGTFPESANIQLKQRITKILSDRQSTQPFGPDDYVQEKLFPDKPTWITEFGYDTNNNHPEWSGVDIVPFGSFDKYTIQGQWLTRYIMEASAAGTFDNQTRLTWVDKVFIYDMVDEKGKMDSQFGDCGLLYSTSSPKKSWYHIRTMKSVLDATKFVRDNSNNDILFSQNLTAAMSPNNPRIYTYAFPSDNQATKPTIAIWLPTGNGATLTGSILIKKKSSTEAKPTIQAIQVVEHDEDGKRTQIHPVNIASIFFDPFLQGGTPQHYWVVSGIGIGESLLISETPLYLRINQSASASDNPVLPVNNLTQSCVGCNTIRLNWTLPSVTPAYYQVYYEKIASTSTTAVFDISKLTLVHDRIPGVSTSAVMPPDLESSSIYRFWVIPFGANGVNGGPSKPFTYSSVPTSSPISGKHYVNVTTLGSCNTSCITPLTASQITITQNPFTAFGAEQAKKAFTRSFSCTGANTLNSELNGADGQISLGSTGTAQFVVDFGGIKKIDAVHIFRFSGVGSIRMEYQTNCCAEYQLFDVITMDDKRNPSLDGVAFWHRITNTVLNRTDITKLRITITPQPSQGFTINAISFCTSPGVACPTGIPSATYIDNQITTAAPSNASTKELNADNATITWDAAKRYKSGVETYPIKDYQVKYSIAQNSAGELIQPVVIDYKGQEWGGENELILAPLAPNTTYYVQVVPYSIACEIKTGPLSFSFTTPDEKVEEVKERTATIGSYPELKLFPNPTSDYINVKIPKGSYTSYRITYFNGIFIKEGNINDDIEVQNINLQGLSNGMYLVTFLGEKMRPQAKAFIVNKE